MRFPDIDQLRIVLYPDPVLKETCAPITEFDAELEALSRRMVCLMEEANGVGLAAPQVGVPIRMFVCNPAGEDQPAIVCINPEFSDLSGSEEMEEGCLSLPGINVTMRRAANATMTACDASGRSLVYTGSGLAARVWQHEVDHLYGKLIIDHMATSDEIANRRAIKQLIADDAKRR